MKERKPYHPQDNLPHFDKLQSEEHALLEDFIRVIKKHPILKARKVKFARELTVFSHGIADLALFIGKPKKTPLNLLGKFLGIFPFKIKIKNESKKQNIEFELNPDGLEVWGIEAKIKDWRGGLRQAYRYKNFSNRAIVLLPESTTKNALAFLNEFKKLNIGLWGFDRASSELNAYFTPARHEPRSVSSRQKLEVVLD